MPIAALVPDVNVLLALQAPEVGAVLMEFLNGIPPNENQGYVNLGRCITGDNLEPYPAARREELARVFSEGWMWLLHEGLVAKRPDDTYGIWYFISRKGRQLKTRAQVEAYRRAAAFPRQLLHPLVAMKAEPPFMRGEYDAAVFQAFKEVEVAVRSACRYPESDYGVDMMRHAHFTRRRGRSQTSGHR